MSDQTLRDLLEERVADLEPRDLSAGAWSAGRRARRRRGAAAAAAAAASLVAVVGLVTAVTGPAPRPAPPAAGPSPSAPPPQQSPTSTGAPETHRGVPVTWAPLAEDERELPFHPGTNLPATIDLSRGQDPAPTGIRVAAMFQLWDDGGAGRVVVVDDSGSSYELDARRLDPVGDRDGNLHLPTGELSLSPDGAHAFFRQEGSLQVHAFADGSWTTIDLPDWLSESARWLDADEIWVPDEVGAEAGSGTAYRLDGTSARVEVPAVPVWDAGEEPYGPALSLGVPPAAGAPVARAYFLTEDEAGGRSYSGVDGVVARTGAGPRLLAFPSAGPGGEVRWKGCCPVVGWADAWTVLVLSRWEETRVLAWDVEEGTVSRVSDVVGWVPGQESYVASFAPLAGGR